MATITELRAKIKRLDVKEKEISKQKWDLYHEIDKIRDEQAKAKANKHLKIGDVRIINDGITNYHCDPLRMYEILDINSKGKWVHVKARTYKLGYADGDWYTRIDIDRNADVETLISAKKIKAKDFEELKSIFSNPDSYEKSKWDTTNYGD